MQLSIFSTYIHTCGGSSAVEDGVGHHDARDLPVRVAVLVSQVTMEEVQIT